MQLRCALPDHDAYSDAYLRDVLTRTKSIAIVGASDNPERDSNRVLRFLLGRGYRVSAVNPKLAGQMILAAPVYATLADVPDAIDMVDMFRNNAAVPGMVDEVLALSQRPKFIWMQLGVRDDAAARKAEAAGIAVVMNRCPAIEIPRLFGGHHDG
jgi:predicted CoA-binding protein